MKTRKVHKRIYPDRKVSNKLSLPVWKIRTINPHNSQVQMIYGHIYKKDNYKVKLHYTQGEPIDEFETETFAEALFELNDRGYVFDEVISDNPHE